MNLKTSQTINNRYKLGKKLGEGSMSVIYEAIETDTSKQVALKFLKKEMTSNYIDDQIRFKKESEMISKLNHTNIVKFFGTGEHNKQPFLIQEVIKGKNLQEYLSEQHPLSFDTIINIALQITEALHYVHSKGIIHRDLKPANIMVSPQKDVINIIVTDFGIAHIMELTQIKESQAIIGTFGYMSPEATGIVSSTIDERSDLYSLGVILYQLISNTLPFQATELNKLIHQQAALIAPNIKNISPATPTVIADIIARLLMKEPELRYQSASGLLHDLNYFQQGNHDFIIGTKDPKLKLSYQTRLLGREEELSTLTKLFDMASNSKGQLCFIGGEPGLGKTRLVESFKEQLIKKGDQNKLLFLQGRCLNQKNKTPYQPFKDILNLFISRIEKLDTENKTKATQHIKKIIGQLGQIIIDLNQNMKQLLGEPPPLVPLESDRENQRFLMTATNFLANLTQEKQTTIYFLDDIQWADEGSLSLVNELIEIIKNKPIMIIATFRIEEAKRNNTLQSILSKENNSNSTVSKLLLKQLNDTQMLALLANLLGQETKNTIELANFIKKKTSGNPFFTITALRELVQEKALFWNENGWQEDWDKIEQINITENIAELLVKRISNLNNTKKRMLKECATIGREFNIKLLNTVSELSLEDIISQLDELIQIQLIEKSPKKETFLFSHDRIHEAILLRINEKESTRLHKKIAEAYEKTYQTKTDVILFKLVYHYAEAKDEENIIKYIPSAARQAKIGYANEEAIKYNRLYIDILEKQNKKYSPEWIDVNEELIDIYVTLGECDKTIQIAETILPLKTVINDKAKIICKMANAYVRTGQLQKCEQTIEKGLALYKIKLPHGKIKLFFALAKGMFLFALSSFFPFIFNRPQKGDSLEKHKIIFSYCLPLMLLYGLSDVNKAIVNIMNMLNRARTKIGKSKELIVSMTNFAVALSTVRLDRSARHYFNAALSMAQSINDLWGEAHTIMFSTFFPLSRGELSASASITENAIKKFIQIGDQWGLGLSYHLTAHALRYQSKYQQSTNLWEYYLKISELNSDYYGISVAFTCLGFNCVEQGDFIYGKKWLLKAIACSEKNNLKYTLCFSKIHLGYLYFEIKDYDNSIKTLEEAKYLYENNTFLKEWTINVYRFLSDAYIEKYKITMHDKTLLTKAEENFRKAKKEKRWTTHYGSALRVAAKIAACKKKRKKASKLFFKSIMHNKNLPRPYEEARAYYDFGRFLASQGLHAQEQFQKAHTIFKKIGAKAYIQLCNEMLDIHDVSATNNSQLDPSISPQERLLIERRLTTLLETSRYLSSILDLDTLLENMIKKATEETGAEWGILYLYDKKNNLIPKIIQNVEGKNSQTFKESRTVLAQVEKNREPIIITDALSHDSLKNRESIIKTGLKSILCAPIIVKEKIYGLIYLYSSMITSLFTKEDLNILEMLCSQAGISIENAILYKEAKEKERLQKEMEIAERIQTAIVPKAPEHPDLEISAVMRPAEEVGGDYYDVLTDAHGNTWFAIGDVTGHGVTPGLIMMMAQASFATTLASNNLSPKEALCTVNYVLTHNIKDRLNEEHFMTMSFLKYKSAGTFSYANAGHSDLLVYRDKYKYCETFQIPGLFLGVKNEIEPLISEIEIQLEKNDMLILYSDGIIEARNKNSNKLLGIDNFKKIIANNADQPIKKINEAILEATLQWCDNIPEDDITLLLIRRR